nr:hypothetical protein [Tanacetum cinerariifolium]
MTFHEVNVETRARSLHIPSVILVRTVASISVGGVSLKGLIDHRLNGFCSHVVRVGVVRNSTRSFSCHRCHDLSKSQESKCEPACCPSLVSCLPLLGESLPSVPDVYGQSLKALLSQSAASENESHVTGVVSKQEFYATVAVSGAKTRVHTPAPGESEAQNGLPDLILSILTTQPACRPSLVSCLPLLGESLPSVPDVYGQSLKALLSQSAASENESHVTGVVSKREFYATVAVSGAKTRVHTPAPGESEAQNGLPDLILSSEPKPLMQYRPHPL